MTTVAILNFQTLNAQLHIPRIILVKFHCNKIKQIFFNFMLTMATVAILQMENPKCTSTHPMDHSCEVLLQYNQTKF